MSKKIITLALIFLSVPALAGKDTYGDVTISQVTTIYDGDSFFANIDSWPEIAGKNIGIRISGIDTPELRGACRKEIELARQAKKITVSMIREAKIIELRRMRRDKYFRIDAEVFTDGKSVGERLIKLGLAQRYYGGKKVEWCPQNEK